jgi:NAD(P) transhydrogenase subunit alpha
MKDAASTMAFDASRLYAKNVANLLELMTVEGRVQPDFADEVVAGACLTHDGEVMHEPTRESLAAEPDETKTAKRKGEL